MSNQFGNLFKITTFGESHGSGIGVIIDGCPAGLKIKQSDIQLELDRRRPGQSKITTPRDEKDIVEIQSGIFNDITIGTPISLFIRNSDQKSQDYDNLKDVYRPSHADYTYIKRYGIRDHRGGGRASNRESAARVAAGAIAKKLIHELCKIETLAWVEQIHNLKADVNIESVNKKAIEAQITRCPDAKMAKEMEKLILQAAEQGDSLGGVVKFLVRDCPAGLGAPVFNKLTNNLASALISINATRSFEIGLGTAATLLKGSSHNDQFTIKSGKIKTKTNNSGGIQGGISNGEDIFGTVAFKPTATIKKNQDTVNSKNKKVTLSAQGRHDPCVLPRAVPIVEAMINLVLADQILGFSLATVDRLKSAIKA